MKILPILIIALIFIIPVNASPPEITGQPDSYGLRYYINYIGDISVEYTAKLSRNSTEIKVVYIIFPLVKSDGDCDPATLSAFTDRVNFGVWQNEKIVKISVKTALLGYVQNHISRGNFDNSAIAYDTDKKNAYVCFLWQVEFFSLSASGTEVTSSDKIKIKVYEKKVDVGVLPAFETPLNLIPIYFGIMISVFIRQRNLNKEKSILYR